MDDFRFWIYIIAGIIFILSRVLKGNKRSADNQETPSSSPRPTPSAPKKTERTLTFEELLREITESKTQQTVPKPYQASQTVTKKKPDYVDYDDDLKEEARDLEDVNYDYKKQDNVYEVYENAKKQAFFKPSLEETLNVKDADMTFGKFKEFDQSYKPSLLEEYVSDLKDLEGFKRAFVLSQVLDRKF